MEPSLQTPTSESHYGPLAPIVGSILACIAWLVFILLYALYWSKGYSLFQNIVVTLASLLIVGLLIALMWVVWGLRSGWRGARMRWGYGP